MQKVKQDLANTASITKNRRNLLLTVPNCLTFWAHFLQIVFVLLQRIKTGFKPKHAAMKFIELAWMKAEQTSLGGETSHLSCWNSDLQYVHFTIGWAMRHSCSTKTKKYHFVAHDCLLVNGDKQTALLRSITVETALQVVRIVRWLQHLWKHQCQFSLYKPSIMSQ